MKFIVRFVVMFFALIIPTSVLAEGFALYEFSARSIALGGATMARKPDPSAIASNPAAIAKLPGINVQAGISFVMPKGEMDGEYPNHSKTGKFNRSGKFHASVQDGLWPVPSFYYTHQINEKFTFGVGIFSRFGLGFAYDNDWPGRFNIYDVELTTSSINPNLAFAITENLSIAAGVEVMYTNLNLKKRINMAAEVMPGMSLQLGEVDANIKDADSIGHGFNLATHYQINDQWAVGLAYRSQVKLVNEGEMEYKLVRKDFPAGADAAYAATFKDSHAKGRVTLPESIAGGLSYSPIPELSFEASAIWTRWSSFKNLDIHLRDMPSTENRLALAPKNWRNAWRLGFGVEYDALDWLTLRAGYAYDQSPMTDEYSDYLIPSAIRHVYSVGTGIKYDNWTFDFAYGYVDIKGRKYRDAPDTTKTLKGNVKNASTEIVSFSVGYKF